MPRPRSSTALAAGCLSLLLATAACGAPSAPPAAPPAPAGSDAAAAATATSAADLGGMDKLVEAAKKEGKLNVIALPPDWANYGEMIETFTDEVRHHRQLRAARREQPGRDQRGQAAARAGPRARRVRPRRQRGAWPTRDLFAPYQVDGVRRHPGASQGPRAARWVNDYAGYMSIGYDAATVAGPDDRQPTCSSPSTRARSRSTATRRRPRPAFHGVMMAALGQRRVGRRHRARASTSSSSSRPPATCCRWTRRRRPSQSGQTPVVIDWDYLNVAQTDALAGKARLEGGRPAERASSAPTTSRRSTRTPRTRRPPGCGRSSCTRRRVRTSG